jgi:hypothetical protein
MLPRCVDSLLGFLNFQSEPPRDLSLYRSGFAHAPRTSLPAFFDFVLLRNLCFYARRCLLLPPPIRANNKNNRNLAQSEFFLFSRALKTGRLRLSGCFVYVDERGKFVDSVTLSGSLAPHDTSSMLICIRN